MKKKIVTAALVGLVSAFAGVVVMVTAPSTASAGLCIYPGCNHNGVCQPWSQVVPPGHSCYPSIFWTESHASCPSDCP